MSHQTTGRPQTVKPDANAVADGTSPSENNVSVKSYEMVEVWLKVSARASGSITQVDYEGSPIDKEADQTAVDAADFDVSKSFTGLTINAVGMFFIGAVSRQNSEALGLVARISWMMTGDITFAVFLVGKE